MLISYEQLIDYLVKLDGESDRIILKPIGKSSLGKPMYIALISSAENIKNINRLTEINRALALDYTLSDIELNKCTNEGKVFVLASLSIHATEVGPSQAASINAYKWVSTYDKQMLKILDNVVLMMVPSQNPDGMDMVVEHYNKYKDTKYESSTFPGLYNKYTGHDDNRDYLFLTQQESKNLFALTSKSWFPQVFVDKHQMGSTGPRFFVPPYHDPISENIDAEIYNWFGIFGQNLVNDMTAAGLKGVSQHNIFDSYWYGSTKSCIWKNVIGFLNECASAQLAKPIYVEPTELNAGGKGLSEYKKSTNFVDPWPGGWWRLSDIVEYEVASMTSILNTASLYKERILRFRNEMCKKEYAKGLNQPPYYYIFPEEQHDKSALVSLVKLIQEHGVDVYRLKSDMVLNKTAFSKNDIVIPLAQPFRSFIKEVLERQKYPERHFTPDGELMEPYDITSWSLPLHMGVESFEINTRSAELEKSLAKLDGNYTLKNSANKYEFAILKSTNNQAYQLVFKALGMGLKVSRIREDYKADNELIPAGSFILRNQNRINEVLNEAEFPLVYTDKLRGISDVPVNIPRIGLVESYFSDMDAGWTRYILDTYNIKYTLLRPGDFENADLTKSFDILIFPDEEVSVLKDGKMKRDGQNVISSYPPEFTKGLGQKGFDGLISFIENGGLVVSWGSSTGLFEGNLTLKTKETTEEFRLPFRNISDQLNKNGLRCPASLVKIRLLNNHPITWGLKEEIGVLFDGKPVFTTSIPNFDMDRRVIGYFPEDDLLMSGYLEGEKLLYSKSSIVWIKKGKGQLVLFGFSPTYRASMPATYKLLFNSIMMK